MSTLQRPTLRRSTAGLAACLALVMLAAACARGGVAAVSAAEVTNVRVAMISNDGTNSPAYALPLHEWPRTKLTWSYNGDLGDVASFRIDANVDDPADPNWQLGVANVVDPLGPSDLEVLSVADTGDGRRVLDLRVVPVFTNGVDGVPVRLVGSVPSGLNSSTWVPLEAMPGSYALPHAPTEVPSIDCELFPADSVIHADVRQAPTNPGSYLHDGVAHTYLSGWETLAGNSTRLAIPVSRVGATDLRFGIPFNVTGPGDATTDVHMMGSAGPNGRPDWTAPPIATDLRVPSDVALKDTDDHGGFFIDTEGGCRLSEFWLMYDYDSLIAQNPEFVAQWYEISPWGTALPGQTKDVDLGARGGAVWTDLAHNYSYPATSSSSARLPVLPLILKVDEVRAGTIDHPLRFAVPTTRRLDHPSGDAFFWPATDSDGTSVADTALPMGLWLRLHEDIDIGQLLPEFAGSDAARAIATALKVHGMILADTGGVADQFTVTAEKSERWQSTASGDGITLDNGQTASPDVALSEVIAALAAYQDEPGAGRSLDDVWQVVDAAAMAADPGTPTMQVK